MNIMCCFLYWFKKIDSTLRLLPGAKSIHYFLIALGTLGNWSTTTEKPSFYIICKAANQFLTIMLTATCSSPSYTIRHKEGEWFLWVQPMLFSPQSSHIQVFLKQKSNILLQCSVSVSEEPLSETSFQRNDAFPKLWCNNFNTDRISMFIVLQQNAPI